MNRFSFQHGSQVVFGRLLFIWMDKFKYGSPQKQVCLALKVICEDGVKIHEAKFRCE